MAGIADDIAQLDAAARARTAVLARNRALLESMHDALQEKNVPATILTRRDDFISPEMRWLVACLKQINRPLDRRNMAVLVDAFKSFVPSSPDFDELVVRAEAHGSRVPLPMERCGTRRWVADLPSQWLLRQSRDSLPERQSSYPRCNRSSANSRGNDANEDLKEDLGAWRRLSGEIRASREITALDQFLRELELRSKGTGSKAGRRVSGDHPRGQGPGVRYGLPDWLGRGDSAFVAQCREGRPQRSCRRRTPELFRCHHPRQATADPVTGTAVPRESEATLPLPAGNGTVGREFVNMKNRGVVVAMTDHT